MPWSGKHGLITRVYLQFLNFCPSRDSTPSCFVSWFLNDRPLNLSFCHFQTLCGHFDCTDGTCIVVQTMLNHIVLADFFALRFSHLLPPGNRLTANPFTVAFRLMISQLQHLGSKRALSSQSSPGEFVQQPMAAWRCIGWVGFEGSPERSSD